MKNEQEVESRSDMEFHNYEQEKSASEQLMNSQGIAYWMFMIAGFVLLQLLRHCLKIKI